MKRRIVLAVLVAALAGFIPTTSVMAAPMRGVHIEFLTPLWIPGPVPFVASGPAVDAGLLCATGFVSTGEVTVSPSPDGDTFLILSTVKYFVCDDGGTFDVAVVGTLDLITGTSSGHWKVLRGTGSYANIKGNGKSFGTPSPRDVNVLEFFDGRLKD